MDTAAYLQRINYSGSRSLNAETLRQLQVAHLLAVPFENISIHWKEPISLDDEALFEKIVRRRRGGFCYEVNGLFAALLRELGFEVVMLSAEVADKEGGFGPEYDHMALMVRLEGKRYLVDVGFGDSFREPLLIDERAEKWDGEHSYRIDEAGGRLTLCRRDDDGEWRAQYRFGLEPHVYADYAGMCRYHQTSPGSHFTRGPICSLAMEEGRVTLSEMRLIRTVSGQRQEWELRNEQEYGQALREHFGIERVPNKGMQPTPTRKSPKDAGS